MRNKPYSTMANQIGFPLATDLKFFDLNLFTVSLDGKILFSGGHFDKV
jgi:hypothetical protein